MAEALKTRGMMIDAGRVATKLPKVFHWESATHGVVCVFRSQPRDTVFSRDTNGKQDSARGERQRQQRNAYIWVEDLAIHIATKYCLLLLVNIGQQPNASNQLLV